jgi:hypothetical protein
MYEGKRMQLIFFFEKNGTNKLYRKLRTED